MPGKRTSWRRGKGGYISAYAGDFTPGEKNGSFTFSGNEKNIRDHRARFGQIDHQNGYFPHGPTIVVDGLFPQDLTQK